MTYKQLLQEWLETKGDDTFQNDAITFLKEHGIEFPRFRRALPMNDQTPFTDEEIMLILNDCLDYRAIIDVSIRKRPSKLSELHGKKRKEAKRCRNQMKKRLDAYASIWNESCGKNVLCVRSRQGGANRIFWPIDTKHPRYIGDVDCWYDNTYCFAFYDFEEELR